MSLLVLIGMQSRRSWQSHRRPNKGIRGAGKKPPRLMPAVRCKRMDEGMEILSGDMELLDRIAPLWEELKKYHVERSPYFSKDMKKRRFEDRKNDLTLKAKHMRVDIVMDLKKNNDIGYCISTIDHSNRGEIDSIFIREPYRRHGFGKKLTEMALAWLNDQGIIDNSIYVASGNDEVIDFYKTFGFYPRGIHLVQKH
jgi:ribosomal protein S18 acetylase RimI-like enzyme